MKVMGEIGRRFEDPVANLWEPKRRSRYPLRDREKHYGIAKPPPRS